VLELEGEEVHDDVLIVGLALVVEEGVPVTSFQ
jgi:hypothetical protein